MKAHAFKATPYNSDFCRCGSHRDCAEHTPDRKTVLLKATYDMLKKIKGARYVISPFETTVFYDEADCDGSCLMDDIAAELNIQQ